MFIKTTTTDILNSYKQYIKEKEEKHVLSEEVEDDVVV